MAEMRLYLVIEALGIAVNSLNQDLAKLLNEGDKPHQLNEDHGILQCLKNAKSAIQYISDLKFHTKRSVSIAKALNTI